MKSSSLDGLEISPPTLVWSFTRAQRRLLGRRADHQHRIVAAIADADLPGADRRAARVNCCSQVVQAGVSAAGCPAVQFFRCRDRLCQICSRYRERQAAQKIRGLIRRMLSPKFLTLTLADDGQPLEQRLDRLIACYRNLRRRPLWRRNVVGAAAVIEITRGRRGDHWHVHLHVLMDAEFIPQASLSAEWLSVTGDSKIVDVRSVASGEKTARYLAKYAAKGCSSELLDGLHLVELVEALHRRRMFITSGSLHGCKADEDDFEPSHQPEGETISVGRIRGAAKQGSFSANTVLRLMTLAGGLPALFACDPDCPIEPLPEETWLKRHRHEFAAAMEQTRLWIERNGPALLPRPRGPIGDQLPLRLN